MSVASNTSPKRKRVVFQRRRTTRSRFGLVLGKAQSFSMILASHHNTKRKRGILAHLAYASGWDSFSPAGPSEIVLY